MIRAHATDANTVRIDINGQKSDLDYRAAAILYFELIGAMRSAEERRTTEEIGE